jgi:ATP-binding cassette, subfamily B, bacterial
MDRILVFDEGKIIEDGTHTTLMQLNGHYANLWHMQVGGFLPDQHIREQIDG